MKNQFKSIQSFDPHLLQDQLICVLKRSPQTQTYVRNRVKQIIVQIMSVPIIQQLKNIIQQLQTNVYTLGEQKEILSQNFNRQMEKNKNTLTKYIQKNKSLSTQLARLKQIEKQKKQLIQQNQQILKQNQQLKSQLENYVGNYQKGQNQWKDQQKLNEMLQNQLKQLKSNFKIKQQQLNKVINEQERIKKISKQTKYNQIKYKRQCQTYEQQSQQLSFQLNKALQDMKIEKIHRENERKALTVKISDLQKKTKKMNKIFKKLKNLSDTKQQLNKQLQNLRHMLKNAMKTLQQQFKQKCYLIMDEIGDQVNKQLSQLMGQMSKNNAQIRILRQQIKIKDQIVHKLQKASSVQLMGNKQLQKQLKSKKIQADSLRKQLKRNYQQTQIKYMGLEHSYRQILASSVNFPIR